MAKLGIKRIYEPALPGDGCRVLVDRLWPRGLSRDAAAIDHWFKEIGPSNELRTWFGHRPERWDEFSRRYRAELAGEVVAPFVRELAALARKGSLTLLYSARDEAHNQAVVLAEVIRAKLP